MVVQSLCGSGLVVDLVPGSGIKYLPTTGPLPGADLNIPNPPAYLLQCSLRLTKLTLSNRLENLMTVTENPATSSFEDSLWEAVEAGSARNFQPFQVTMAEGGLSRNQLGIWAAQQYAVVRPFKSWLAGIHMNCSLESAEHHIIENMWEEMGFGEQGKDHPALFEKFAAALGWSRERMAENVVAETTAFVGYYSWATRSLPFEESMALVGLVIEGNPRARGELTTLERDKSKRELWQVLSEEYDLTRDDVEFWELHTSADVVHAQRSMEIIVEAAVTPLQKERVIARVHEGFDVWGLKQAGIGRAIDAMSE